MKSMKSFLNDYCSSYSCNTIQEHTHSFNNLILWNKCNLNFKIYNFYLNLLAKTFESSFIAALVTAWPTAWLTCCLIWGGNIWCAFDAAPIAPPGPPRLHYVKYLLYKFDGFCFSSYFVNYYYFFN